MISGDDDNISISLKPAVKKVVKKRTNKTIDDDCQCCAYLYKYQKGGARAKRCSREKNGSGDFCIMHKKTMIEKYANKDLPTQGGEQYIFVNEDGEYYYGKKCLFTKRSGFRKQRPFKVEYVWQQFGAVGREFIAVDQEGIEFYRGDKAFFFTNESSNETTIIAPPKPPSSTSSLLIQSSTNDSDDDEEIEIDDNDKDSGVDELIDGHLYSTSSIQDESDDENEDLLNHSKIHTSKCVDYNDSITESHPEHNDSDSSSEEEESEDESEEESVDGTGTTNGEEFEMDNTGVEDLLDALS
tara:strand:+ start:6440 stop:7333 length:894 start_codon:yes stop_codon:yes gene_type:complete